MKEKEKKTEKQILEINAYPTIQIQVGELALVVPLLDDHEVVNKNLEILIEIIKTKILQDKDYKAYMKFFNKKQTLRSQGYAG